MVRTLFALHSKGEEIMKKETYLNPVFKTNPITVLVLGVCSALAVTVKLEAALVMAISVMLVTGFSSMFVSIIRKTIPNRIRIIVQLVIVAFFVILIDQFLRAYSYQVSKQLSVYIGLIITNCIVMGRIEGFGLKNKPIPSFVDGFSNGFGYGLVLVTLAIIREFFGSGCFFNMQVIPQSWYDAGYVNNGLMILPPMALILVGLIIWVQRSVEKELIEK